MGHFLFRCLPGIVAVAAATAQTVAPLTVARWPGDRQAAVSLTFDDGLDSHLDKAGPILKKHGLHGTFFVITGGRPWRTREADWKRLAAEGNELGGHTATHPCLIPRIKPHSQDYTPAMMAADIRSSAEAILTRTGTLRGLTFAYPCGNIGFGPPADQTRNAVLHMSYVSDNFFAARMYVESGGADPESLSVLTVPDLARTVGLDFAGLLALAEPVMKNRQWGIFSFHGIGAEYLTVGSEALDELAGYLERHAEIWTAPFGDVVRYIQESHALETVPAGSGIDGFEFNLRWPLDRRTYDLPLTLRWKLPAGSRSAGIEANGRPVAGSQLTTADGTLVFDVPPGTKALRLKPE